MLNILLNLMHAVFLDILHYILQVRKLSSRETVCLAQILINRKQ